MTLLFFSNGQLLIFDWPVQIFKETAKTASKARRSDLLSTLNRLLLFSPDRSTEGLTIHGRENGRLADVVRKTLPERPDDAPV
jgi:hypothetical protein